MQFLLFAELSPLKWIAALISFCFLPVLFKGVYNLYFHPLARVPGPFWARASGLVSYYYALRGDRHIWIWQQFEIYGNRVRVAPGIVLFRDPQAANEIYGNKSNVRRSPFYTALKRNMNENSTMNTIEVDLHANKRKLLNQSFSEKSTRAACAFIVKHVDRLHDIMVDKNDIMSEWSPPIDFSNALDAFAFDVMGDLSFDVPISLARLAAMVKAPRLRSAI
ncbi:hypothetical protein O1611_g2208 [Lasiodiplodia mahajangana]|uniref:Uncharacterized protein n=1 Tax=Lasiodiplodia mahajangana TaxID=1108764 RepID=A0ACC2JVW6_9PEZI|nr:hypothetical protein O1611_g2208 [Lasiodiplodia mahajangana]